MTADLLLGSVMFIVLTMTLVTIVLVARAILVSRRQVHITVNGARTLDGRIGDKLLDALEEGGVHLAAGCGGTGKCGMCRVFAAGAGQALPTERVALSAADIARGVRLACQVVVRGPLTVTVPAEALTRERWACTVSRSRWLAPFIKEIVLTLPDGQTRKFPAGSFVRVTAPPFTLPLDSIPVDPAYEEVWQQHGLRPLTAHSTRACARAYSLANHPGETDVFVLNVRLAQPPAGQDSIPPGVVSSYLCGLAVGATVPVAGPFGDFFIMDTDREIILVGGGVGMAPLRAQVFDQLEYQHTSRLISYWYGARSRIDLYYVDDMERIARTHENFSWHVALSDPRPEDAWHGPTGFIHDVLDRQYLQSHPDPTRCEYYLCGPPLMVEAVRAVLHRLGVPHEQIRHDDFGG